MEFKSIEFRLHAIQRIYERGISPKDVKNIVKSGKIIENYPKDIPFPSYLILGFVNEKPLHVVAAIDHINKKAIIITVYEPNPKLWQKDFEKRE